MSALAIWVNGQMASLNQPHVPADDHGVIVGDGAFETLLVVSSRGHRQAFAVRRHLERLRHSAAVMHLDCPYHDDDLRNAISQCLAAAPGAGLVRITVTSGGGPLGSGRGKGPGSTMVIAGQAPPAYSPGAAVAVMPFPRNERSVLAGVKTTSYAENVLALRLANKRGASEAIFADTQGRLSEGTGSNIFWIDQNTLHTPPLDTGCLAGVTRSLVMELLDVNETYLPVDELASVNETFLTSTTRSVQSIGSVDGNAVPVVDGPLTRKATAAMADLIATNIDP